MTPRSADLIWKKPLASHNAATTSADQQQERATLAAFATRPQQRLELALPAFDALVEIRTALARPPSPGIVLTAARLIPRHM